MYSVISWPLSECDEEDNMISDPVCGVSDLYLLQFEL